MKGRVFITGANGFIGSHIVREFLANSVEVTCMVRKESSVENIEGLDVEIVNGDVRDPEAMIELIRGHDSVIHNAALANDWNRYPEFYETNVSGTEAVLNACFENGVEHIIMTGSISSYGEEDNRDVKDEQSDYNPHYDYFMDGIIPCRMNHYRDTKALATQVAVGIAKSEKLNLTVLEPAFTYGEREFNTGFYEYVKSAKSGMLVAPGRKGNKFPVIYAGDLAKAYFMAFQRRPRGIDRIIIGNYEPTDMDTILSIFCREAGVKKPVRLSKWAFYVPALIMESVSMLWGRKDPPTLTRGRVNMFVDNVELSAKKAETVLGFKSTTSLEEGIGRTVKWYRENGYL